MAADIVIRIVGIIIDIKLKSTCIRTVIEIAAKDRHIATVEIRIILKEPRSQKVLNSFIILNSNINRSVIAYDFALYSCLQEHQAAADTVIRIVGTITDIKPKSTRIRTVTETAAKDSHKATVEIRIIREVGRR